MDFMEISKKRVTVRKFAQTPVENEKFRKLWRLDAGLPQRSMASPSESWY